LRLGAGLAYIVQAVVNNSRRVNAIFAALADATRRSMLVRLSREGEIRVTTLAGPFRISLPAISRHLRVLESAGLIQRRRRGRVHLIRTRPAGVRQAQRWLAELAAGWNFSFDKLDELLQKDQEKERSR
jgi:DNA-binding transcriptional ArsR family regulator